VGLSFQLSEEQKLFRESFRRFVEKEIAPHVEEAEEKEEFPRWFFKRMAEMGYLCITYPEEYEGAGADRVTDCLLI